MWDDAVLTSVKSGKPTLAFDLDLVDSSSIKLAQELIDSKELQDFISARFEPALNDFAVDPPPVVGLDSLRNLGWRLSGLEKDYGIAVRPVIIVIGHDKEEMDRIVFPQRLSVAEIEKRLTEILEGRNTLKSTIAAFWRDTTSILMHQKLIDMFEERSKYDSVLKHFASLKANKDFPAIARIASVRYASLRLEVEGAVSPLESLMSSLGSNAEDSVLHLQLIIQLLEHYQKKKKTDSVAMTFKRIMAFTGTRDPELLNDYAWHIANYAVNVDTGLSLINEAIAKDSTNPNFYDTRALVYTRLHRYDDAIRDEETAIRYAEKDDKAYFEQQETGYKNLKAEAENTPKPVQK
jgi:tetratricopeptide (TPR) repeat protein